MGGADGADADMMQASPELKALYTSEDPRTFIDVLMQVLKVNRGDYVMGTSKLFFKSGKLAIMHELMGSNAQKFVAGEVKDFLRRKKLRRT